ncbi:anti-sigma regulatory factor (Ser/Thr protein kinase) [Stella humosa]|uniref:Anti-sigma regulatory factor (Ser/Thr protein kinase) n=1 Tax=Stella humosa TaxID=94 RepID=A0A3N1MFD7_9PROT|nr:hypothetical protein [Stella humosa]ROQ02049.1 anti-sigma regulatory factor (Ser/Thr protein kinase) [Stella humosa]
MTRAPAALARILAADPAQAAELEAGVERAALACGLDAPAAARLAQAVEEVFVFVATRAPGTSFGVELRDRRHRIDARLRCRLPTEALHWFNITQAIDVSDPDALDALGLLLASRLVDRLSVSLDPDGGILLTLEQARQYPIPAEGDGPSPAPAALVDAPAAAVGASVPGLARLFRQRMGISVPRQFQADGLVRDLVEAGDLSALVVHDAAGHVQGGVAWTQRQPKLVEMLGPVTAGDDPAVAAVLVEAAILALAGSGVAMIYAEERGPGFPEAEFDCLGQLGSRPLHFRVIAEDVGAVTWADSVTRPFLAVFYEALGLARGVSDAPAAAVDRPERALLAAEIDRVASRVTLRPLLDGTDLPTLIAEHVDRFAGEGLDDFRFETDHGVPWQGGIGRDLMQAGFFPRVVLPHGGLGDVIVWERDWMPM